MIKRLFLYVVKSPVLLVGQVEGRETEKIVEWAVDALI
jgi:hypothetical protein